LGSLLTGRPEAGVVEAVAWVEALVAELAIPQLSQFGLSAQLVPTAVERATVASSTRSNPITLTEDELTEIVTAAL
jgi:alcohol dehydrogenase class IV